MENPMTSKRERLETAFRLEEPDRTPILGGWLACPEYIMELAEVTADEYWADPAGTSIRAYEVLGMDGLIAMLIPSTRDDYRIVTPDSYAKADRGASLEEAVAEVDAMSTPEQIEAQFDFDAAYEKFREGLLSFQGRCGDMVWMPAQWGAGANVSWYGKFGYQNYGIVHFAQDLSLR